MLEIIGEQCDAFFSTPNLSAWLLAHILSDSHMRILPRTFNLTSVILHKNMECDVLHAAFFLETICYFYFLSLCVSLAPSLRRPLFQK